MTNGNHPSRPAKRRVSLSLAVSLAVLCLGMPARAEEGSSRGDGYSTESATPGVNLSPSVYLTLAVGGVSGVGPAGMAAFTVGGESFQVTGRISGASEIRLFGPAYNTMTEYGLMVGGGHSVGVTRFYTSAGVGTITLTSRGREISSSSYGGGWHALEYETVSRSAFNVPLQVGLDFGVRYVSAGAAFVANINTAKSSAGVMLTLNLGRLTPRT